MKRSSLSQATAQLAGSALDAKIDDLFTRGDLIQCGDEGDAPSESLSTTAMSPYNNVPLVAQQSKLLDP